MKFKRISLITPPSVFLLDERVFVSLGILKVAASLEQHGLEVEHLDLNGVQNYLDVLRIHLQQTTCEVFGLTVTTPQFPSVTKLVALIREMRPGARIILGGPHITLTHSGLKFEKKRGVVGRAHQAWQRLQEFADVLVSGDGEFAIFAALSESPPKIVDGDDPNGPFFMTDEMYNQSPLAARHLVDLPSYHYEIEGRRASNLIAQLGCPFGCGFCGGRNSKSLRKIRVRTTESVTAEIEMLYKTYGYTGFMLYDDELNVNKEMLSLMNSIADLQTRLGVEFRLRGFVKSQLFTQEQAHAMYRAGFRWILVGFESGAPRILENINKRATVQENDRCLQFAKNAGLKVKALMSIGHPGESEETVRQTQEWLLRNRPDDFDCTLITTYPGTPYYDEAVPHESLKNVWTYTQPKSGDKLHAFEIDYSEVADYYKGDPQGGYKSYVFTETLSCERLVELRSWVEASVREEMRIPYPTARPSLRYEHSMGQGTQLRLPNSIFSMTSKT